MTARYRISGSSYPIPVNSNRTPEFSVHSHAPSIRSHEGHKWFFQISANGSHKNRFSFVFFGKIQFLKSPVHVVPHQKETSTVILNLSWTCFLWAMLSGVMRRKSMYVCLWSGLPACSSFFPSHMSIQCIFWKVIAQWDKNILALQTIFLSQGAYGLNCFLLNGTSYQHILHVYFKNVNLCNHGIISGL